MRYVVLCATILSSLIFDIYSTTAMYLNIAAIAHGFYAGYQNARAQRVREQAVNECAKLGEQEGIDSPIQLLDSTTVAHIQRLTKEAYAPAPHSFSSIATGWGFLGGLTACGNTREFNTVSKSYVSGNGLNAGSILIEKTDVPYAISVTRVEALSTVNTVYMLLLPPILAGISYMMGYGAGSLVSTKQKTVSKDKSEATSDASSTQIS